MIDLKAIANKIILFNCLLALFYSPIALYAQSLDDLEDETPDDALEAPDSDASSSNNSQTSEKILKVSNSKRILVLTNNGGNYAQGDFVSIVLNDKLLSRGIVAKQKQGVSALKVTKIYAVDLWKTVRPNLAVSIIRGDDSTFKSKKVASSKKLSAIDSEDDLYNSTGLFEDDLNIKENKKRSITTDNLIGAFIGLLQGQNADGTSAYYKQFMGQWAYQIHDNMWLEFAYGQNLIKDYPVSPIDTKLSNFTFRGKYTFPAPMSSYLQPYFGFQLVKASSPGAGQGNQGAEKDAKEIQLVEALEKKTLIFGVSVLKRLVSGWFIKGDIGSDIISLGLSLEF